MVYDREMGSMRVLLTSPLPRSFAGQQARRHGVDLLAAGLCVSRHRPVLRRTASTAWADRRPARPSCWWRCCSAPWVCCSQWHSSAGELCRRDEFRDFSDVLFSSALYPLWKMREASEWLYWICALNPSPTLWSWFVMRFICARTDRTDGLPRTDPAVQSSRSNQLQPTTCGIAPLSLSDLLLWYRFSSIVGFKRQALCSVIDLSKRHGIRTMFRSLLPLLIAALPGSACPRLPRPKSSSPCSPPTVIARRSTAARHRLRSTVHRL